MMSRKHYNAIADAIAEVRKNFGEAPVGVAMFELQHRLAEVFAAENEGFSEGRFHAACLRK